MRLWLTPERKFLRNFWIFRKIQKEKEDQELNFEGQQMEKKKKQKNGLWILQRSCWENKERSIKDKNQKPKEFES